MLNPQFRNEERKAPGQLQRQHYEQQHGRPDPGGGTLVGGTTFRFADSSGASWATGEFLSIWNWTAGTDHLYFGTSASGLLASQLSQIHFYSDSDTTLLGSYSGFTGSLGEIVPVPEPSSVFIALGLYGLIGFRERQRSRAFARRSRSG